MKIVEESLLHRNQGFCFIIISASKITTAENILVQSPTGVETDPTLEASKTRLKAEGDFLMLEIVKQVIYIFTPL